MKNKINMANEISEMFNGASVVRSTRTKLVSFLEEVRYEASNEIAGAVASTLIDRLDRFSNAFCSDKQAYALACGAVEHGIEL